MEVGSQTDPMDPQDILNQLLEKSLEMGRRKVTMSSGGDQEEIHQAPLDLLDGEVFFNSQNEPEFRRNSHPFRKSPSTPSKPHPVELSLTDKICEAVWGRKDSLRVAGSNSTKSKKLERSQSFKGSSSTSSSLSPAPKIHTGDPFIRRASGSVCSSHIRSAPSSTSSSHPNHGGSSGKDYNSQSPSTSLKFDALRVRRSHGDIDLRRQISSTLNIPSREDSVKSCYAKSTSGQQSPIIVSPCVTIQPIHFSGRSNHTHQHHPNNNNLPGHQFPRLSQGHMSSSRSLVQSPSLRGSRSNSITPTSIGPAHLINNNEVTTMDKEHRKCVVMGFTFLLVVAVLCVTLSLSISSYINARVRKENENLMRVIQQTTSTSNSSATNQTSSSTLSPLPPIGIEDQDENNNNYNSNSMSNTNNNVNPGQSITKSVMESGQEGLERVRKSSKETSDLDVDRGGGGDEDESRPLSSSLIGAVLLDSLNTDVTKSDFQVNVKVEDESYEKQPSQSSPTEFKSGNSKILLGQISDNDEVDRVRTSIVLR